MPENAVDNANLFIRLVIAPLIIAGVLYYIFFPEVAFVRFIDRSTDLYLHISLPENNAVRIIRNYLFDAVWAVAFASSLYIMISDNMTVIRIFIIAALFESVMEFVQIIPLIQGTFDPVDIVIEIIASALVLVYLYRRRKKDL